jgi:anthranilate 1,2-dioxygenase large subunit
MWVYTDPDIYQRELDLFFYGKTWNYVALECEIPNSGDFKRNWIGERQVLVVRQEDGSIRVIENRCAHRGARICWKNKGNEQSFTCPYHQWNYALDGTLQGIPLKRGVGGRGGMARDFDNTQHGLSNLSVHVEGGVVWASFDPAPPSFEEYCGPDLLAYLRRVLNGRPLRLLGYSRQGIKSNWKLYLENLKDPYHATLLHAFYITFGFWRADAESESIPTGEGQHSIMTSRHVGKKSSDATAEIARFDDKLVLNDSQTASTLPDFDDGKVGGWILFPSIVLHQQVNSLAIRHLVPKGPGEFELTWNFFGYADDPPALAARRLRHANLFGPAGYVSMEDGEVLAECQLNAGGYGHRNTVVEMGGRDVAGQNHMITEVMIRGFYRYYRQAMGL